ncbi:hypothetical protein JOD54_006719 [Actinokineospora baliensis]|uniref:hypothetical protein n=1 Tax=Actinokineospora baliensis TaxID=547056 RepID=UPI00195A1389|nr:hypothetical protein [Actinokineospora baliensis]MBM7776515.1 hypothetical protein [Actinokineospora baliensis]
MKAVRICVAAALLGAVVWLGLVGAPAVDEARFRAELREEGTRYTARVVEAGFVRADGALREVVVTGPFGDLVGIDLAESSTAVHSVGDELRVVVPAVRYHRGLPEDVVDRSAVSYVLARIAFPGTTTVVLVGALLFTRRARP